MWPQHVFVDDWMVASAANASVGVARLGSGRQVIAADEPWEEGCMVSANYAAVLRRETDGVFQMWYSVDCSAPYAPRGPNANHSHTGYAESRTGLVWTKPRLGLVEYRGSSQNNIAPMGGPVWIDPVAPAAARYKTQSSCNGSKPIPWSSYPMCYYGSPDGLRDWTLLARLEIGQCDGMSNFIFWDPSLSRYQLYARHWIAPTKLPVAGKCPAGYYLVDSGRLCADEHGHCASCYRAVRRQLSTSAAFPRTAAEWGCSDDPYRPGGCNLTVPIAPDAIDSATHPVQDKGKHKTSITPLDYYVSDERILIVPFFFIVRLGLLVRLGLSAWLVVARKRAAARVRWCRRCATRSGKARRALC